MIEIIPSNWMRDYLKKHNRELSDREKATMIWNLPNINWNDRLEALKQLETETSDVILQKQIRERIQFEQKEFAKLKDNSGGKYVYVVEDDLKDSYGFFSDYEIAYKKLLNCIDEYAEFSPQFFAVKKYALHSADESPESIDDSEFEDASVTFDMQGNITYFYTSVESEWHKNLENRFENAFFRIPCGLNYCSVKVLEDNSYGVVHSTEEQWDAYMDKWSDSGLDYSDIQVVVYSLTENGVWSHKHVNPLFLEPQMPKQIPGDEKRKALIEATSALVQYFENETEENANYVLKTARKYANECQKLKVAEIDSIDDIFS